MNPYEESFHRIQETLAALILRKDVSDEAKMVIMDCDRAVEEIFMSCGEVIPFPEIEQKKNRPGADTPLGGQENNSSKV